ncbi:MAG TPA: ribonuclease HII [Candidatus Dormibacteraeota bacterium]|nr:ribonuclease HII [Candidatus Dormibacteraeota bacterium]
MGLAHRQAARRRVLLRHERALWTQGLMHVAGVDEVGVGPLAGPLVAAAVILPHECEVRGIDDSKKLTAARREALRAEIEACAVAVGIGVVEVRDVERLNTYWASIEAMRRAVAALAVPPQQVLVDARHIPGLAMPQLALVKGDARSYSIAAASIVAKVVRDAMMTQLDGCYPAYGFARHMGYGTAEHLAALERHGPCPAHRRSFLPVAQARLPGL